MASIDWNDPVSGDWSVATDWSTGTVPTQADTVFISDLGPPYTVTVSGADFANSLVLNAVTGALLENSGSLTIEGELHVISGLAQLNKANTIGSVSLAAGGVIEVGNGGALGTGTVTQSGGSIIDSGVGDTLTVPSRFMLELTGASSGDMRLSDHAARSMT